MRPSYRLTYIPAFLMISASIALAAGPGEKPIQEDGKKAPLARAPLYHRDINRILADGEGNYDYLMCDCNACRQEGTPLGYNPSEDQPE